jgi:hypothetical protein
MANFEQARLTQVLGSKDKIDTKIIRNTVNMIVGLKLDSFMLTDKKLHDEYFGHIMDAAQSLCKANNHRRKYLEQEKKILKKFKKKSMKNPNTADLGMKSIELDSEIDGVLSHTKAAMDSYAKSLRPLLGIKLNGWHRVKKESGREIVNALENNLPAGLKQKAEPLKKHIEDNMQWVSYIVFLRDSPHHHGGMKNVTEIVFQQLTKKVIPQMINHPNRMVEEVGGFLTRHMDGTADFFRDLIALSLLIKAPGSMGIAENTQTDWPSYNWFIITQNDQPQPTDGSSSS